MFTLVDDVDDVRADRRVYALVVLQSEHIYQPEVLRHRSTSAQSSGAVGWV